MSPDIEEDMMYGRIRICLKNSNALSHKTTSVSDPTLILLSRVRVRSH